jgi:hypothetical protein
LIRVFERAFAVGSTTVCKHFLPAFLAPAGFGFTDDEVQNWLTLRDRSVHADRRPDFALESETQPVVNRVEQAAYDVLFNKSSWRDETTTRRDVFHPWLAAGDSRGEETVLYKGGDLQLDVRPLDGFGAYPVFPKNFGPTLPDGWVGPEGSSPGEQAQLAGSILCVRADPQAGNQNEAETGGLVDSAPSLVETAESKHEGVSSRDTVGGSPSDYASPGAR